MPRCGPVRALGLLLAALLLTGGPALGSGFEVLAEEGGHFEVGLVALGVEPVNLARIPFNVTGDHTNLGLTLTYEPDRTGVELGGNGLSLDHRFRAELRDAAGTRLISVPLTHAGTHALCTVPAAGAYTLELYLTTGADVHWNLTVLASDVISAPFC